MKVSNQKNTTPPFRSPFSKLSSGKVMILFMFWNWVKQRERGGDRDGRTKEASRETARQKSRERERNVYKD